jgi:hypothetical protein
MLTTDSKRPTRAAALVVVLLSACVEAQPRAATPPPLRQTAPAAPASADVSQNFDKEVRLMFRLVACSGNEPMPEALAAAVSRHCQAFQPIMANYRKKYLPVAQPFLLSLQPKDLPDTVLYPFGGGDLLSALTTYPNLKEVTTLSLEHAGDPRTIDGMSAEDLELGLAQIRRRVSGLLVWTESTSENMIQMERGGIPGQLAFFLVGLAVHDQEPVGLRFFDLTAEGAVRGISAQDVAARKASVATRLNPVWKAPSFSDAFSNSEITFRKAGDDQAPRRIHRHIAVNLSNEGLRKDPEVLKHLQAKGRITAMTKAASYLLWSPDFSGFCDYLLSNMTFMVSDSTGIPPRLAQKAGFEVVPYGRYAGPFLPAPAQAAKDMLALFASQPLRELTFRYGYPDNAHHDHLLVTRLTSLKPRAEPMR